MTPRSPRKKVKKQAQPESVPSPTKSAVDGARRTHNAEQMDEDCCADVALHSREAKEKKCQWCCDDAELGAAWGIEGIFSHPALWVTKNPTPEGPLLSKSGS